jgi:branched-chain amino acid transport system ATP-binding protein
MSYLTIRNLNVWHGNARALTDISLEIHKGEIVALIGSNGAGKSTLLRTIIGTNRNSKGSITFEGEEIRSKQAYEIARSGISLVPEGRGLFPSMSVVENLKMGCFALNFAGSFNDKLTEIFELFPRLKERKEQLAGTLSGGEQQMLAIGQAIISSPKLLMLDEPSLGISPLFVERIFESIQKINQLGTTIFLVEQNVALSLETANRGYVLENGQITLSGESPVLLGSELVKTAFLGI